ncbi:MAG: glycosyltransferase family 39 protein [Candidatus Omnitrophica bacterium]|nr:glycosyltransferase family 39 protein [Candidatus Omnitrophota bacterium]
MTSGQEKFCVVIIILLALLLNVLGINWGVPSQERAKLIFENQAFLNAFVPLMKETRAEIRDAIKYENYEYPLTYNEKQKFNVTVGKKKFLVEKATVNAMRTYLLRAYSPDEHMAIIGLSNIDLKKREFNPKIFSCGGAYIYTSGFLLFLLKPTGLVNLKSDLSYYLLNPDEMGNIYMVIRFLGVLATAAAVYFLYRLGKKFYGAREGMLAAFLLAIAPIVVVRNHYASPYTFGFLFVLLSFYAASFLLEKNRLRFYALAGIFAGLAAGSIVFFIFSLVSLPISFLIYYHQNKSRDNLHIFLKGTVLALFCAAAVFILTNPYAVIAHSAYAEVLKYDKQMEPAFHFAPVYYLFGALKAGFGLFFVLLLLFGVVLNLKNKTNKRQDIFLILFFVCSFLFFSCFTPWYVRRGGVFLAPFACLIVARFFFGSFPGKMWNNLFRSVCICAFIYQLLYTVSYVKIFNQRNVRDEAGDWINHNIAPGESIGLMQPPAPFRTPPFAFYRYNLFPVGLDKKLLDKDKPEYFLCSEYEIQSIPGESLNNFLRDYRVWKKFENPAQVFGFRFNRTALSPRDWCYPNPYVVIFKRTN